VSVPQLKSDLRKFGLRADGNKKALLDRLKSYRDVENEHGKFDTMQPDGCDGQPSASMDAASDEAALDVNGDRRLEDADEQAQSSLADMDVLELDNGAVESATSRQRGVWRRLLAGGLYVNVKSTFKNPKPSQTSNLMGLN